MGTMGGEGEREGAMVGKGMLEERGNKWREEREAICHREDNI